MRKDWKIAESAGAGAKCDHFKLGVRTHVRAHLNLDVRGACVRATQKTVATHTLFISNVNQRKLVHSFQNEMWIIK